MRSEETPTLSELSPAAAGLAVGWALAGVTALLAGTDAVAGLALPAVDPLWPAVGATVALLAGAARVSLSTARRLARLAGAAAVYGAALGVLLWIGLDRVDLDSLLAVVRALLVAGGALWVALGAVAVPRHWPDSRPDWWPTDRADDSEDAADRDRSRLGVDLGRAARQARTILFETDDRASNALAVGGAALVAGSLPVAVLLAAFVDQSTGVQAWFLLGGIGAAGVVVGVVGLGTDAAGDLALGAAGVLVGSLVVAVVVGLAWRGIRWALGGEVPSPGAAVDAVLAALLAGIPLGVAGACAVVVAAVLVVGYPAHWLLRERSALRPDLGAVGAPEVVVVVAVVVPAVSAAFGSGEMVSVALLGLLAAALADEAVVWPLFRLTLATTPVLGVPWLALGVLVPESTAYMAVVAAVFAWMVSLVVTSVGVLFSTG